MDKLSIPILIFLCFLVYANSLNGAFISDDIMGIVKNPDVHFSKNNPLPYHLINVFLHCLVTILVFYFLKGFFKPLTSLLGASLFAIHPIHTEAVSWISGQPYIIVALFTLGIYFFYQKKIYYPIALGLFIYYSTKSFHSCILIGMFLILMNLIYKKGWLKIVPFLWIMLISLFFHQGNIQQRAVLIAQDVGRQWTNPIFNMVYSLCEHLKLLIYPIKLTLYHEPNTITRFMINIELVILTLLMISLPFIYKKAKPIFLAIGIFILFLGFTYSPVMVSWLIAERYLYIPVISLSLILCFFYERFESKKALAIFIAIIAIYGTRTIARNEDWKTPNRFWRSTVENSPLSPRAHNNMADIYCKEGNLDAGIVEFRQAIRIKPDYAEAYYNLASVYKFKGEVEAAEKLYAYAYQLKPSLKDIKK